MRIVSAENYATQKKYWFAAHDNDFVCDTSTMDEYGQYHKTYTFADGAQWFENMRPVWEMVEAEVRKVNVKLEVKLFETEFYNTDNADSFYYYERF